MAIDRQAVLDKYNGHCGYCGKLIGLKTMQVDHMHAKYLGGTDDPENLMPSCRSCNFYKGSMTVEVFRSHMMRLTERLMKIFIVRLAIDHGFITMHEWDRQFYFEKEDVER